MYSTSINKALAVLVILQLTCTPCCLFAESSEDEDPVINHIPDGAGTIVTQLENRMSEAELQVFLNKRTSGQVMGSFNSYLSLLFAVSEVSIHSEVPFGEQRVQSTFPKDYRPTWREHLDMLARQVQCTWRYDHATGFYHFDKNKIIEYPYTIELAKGWNTRDQGNHVVHIPPQAHVGMDIYTIGKLTCDKKSDEAQKAFYQQARIDAAMKFAVMFNPDVTDKDMSIEKVGPYDALHFKINFTKTNIIWRQWSIIHNDKAFFIVSAIKPEQDDVIYPDVVQMLNSFQVKENEISLQRITLPAQAETDDDIP